MCNNLNRRCTVLLSFLSVFAAHYAICQVRLDERQYLDSLLTVWKSADGQKRASVDLTLCAVYFTKNDSASIRYYLADALEHAGSDQFLKDAKLMYEADLFYDNDRKKAISMYKHADSALEKYTTRDAYFLRSKIWSRIAALRQLEDDENAFLETLTTKSMPFAIKSQNPARISAVYLDVGIALYNALQFDQSNQYFRRAINVLDGIPTPYKSRVEAHLQIAQNYIMLEKYDSVKYFLDKIKPVIFKYPTSVVVADYYHMSGIYYYKVKDYKNSFSSLEKGVAVAQKLNEPYLAGAINNRKFNFYFEQKQYQNALNVLNESSTNQKLMTMQRNRMSMVYNYSRVFGAMGQYQKAYDSLSKFLDIFDSLTTANFYDKTKQLEAKFNVAQKENKIAKLEATQKQQELSAKNQKLINSLLAIASVLLCAITVFLFYYYKNSRKLSAQKEINHQQQLNEIEQQNELKIAQAMLEGEERERRRMARDLHDGLGGMLAGLKMNLSRQSKMEHQNLDSIIDQLDNSVSELRRIARNMMPESLLKIGLEAALRDLCESISGEKIFVEYQPYNIKPDIPAATQANIYRIAQELLSNAIRHANASKIILQCSQNDQSFLVTVEDNGKGFDINSIKDAKGIGFSNIQNRVNYLKGKMEINSIPGDGTTINIELNV